MVAIFKYIWDFHVVEDPVEDPSSSGDHGDVSSNS